MLKIDRRDFQCREWISICSDTECDGLLLSNDPPHKMTTIKCDTCGKEHEVVDRITEELIEHFCSLSYDFEDLHKTDQKELVSTLNFGTHADKTWMHVLKDDRQYLIWLKNKTKRKLPIALKNLLEKGNLYWKVQSENPNEPRYNENKSEKPYKDTPDRDYYEDFGPGGEYL